MTLDLDRLGSPEARGFIELGARGGAPGPLEDLAGRMKSYFIERSGG